MNVETKSRRADDGGGAREHGDDPEAVLDQVDVAPPERLQFGPPDTGQHEREERDPVLVVLERPGERLHLSR